MSSIHQDEELIECAVKTASNGKKILRLLKGSDDVINNCNAILSVCRGAEEEAEVESGELIGVSLCPQVMSLRFHTCVFVMLLLYLMC